MFIRLIILVCLLAIIFLSITDTPAVAVPPSEGDWVVAGTEIVENEAITLNGNLIIKGGGIVRLIMTPGSELAPGKMTVSARSEEIGDDVGEIDATVEGEEAKIAFNGKYLTDVLGTLKEPQVALEITNPSSPGIIRPVGTDNYIHVVMPMFVQW